EIDFDAWVIMPDHLHGVVLIESINPEGANNHLPLRQTPIGANGCLLSLPWRNAPINRSRSQSVGFRNTPHPHLCY
ncbi:MAG: hypothetical protein WBG38_04155, partial [Nodosilinea sp.]